MRFQELAVDVRLVQLDATAASELDALSLRCADFLQLVEGRAPGANEGRRILTETPTDFPIADKFVLGVRSPQELIGVADVLRNYPARDIWWIGLLLLAPEVRGRGIGRRIVAAVAAWAGRQGATALQLAVQPHNAAGLHFWRQQGFNHIGARDQRNGRRRNGVLVMKRRLDIGQATVPPTSARRHA